MKVVYFAVSDFDEYKAGDLIPAAVDWTAINMYVEQNRVAPVLVATLPEHVQEKLAAWEKATGRTPDDDVDGEVVNEEERAEARRQEAEEAAEAAAKAQEEAEAAARAEREAAKAEQPADEAFDYEALTKEQLVERINEQGFIEAHISSNKPELIKQAKESDELVALQAAENAESGEGSGES